MVSFPPIESIINNLKPWHPDEAVVAEFVLRYYHAMNEAERRFPYSLYDAVSNSAQERDLLDQAIAAKREVYCRFWQETDDDFWKPCNHGDVEDHRVSDIDSINVRHDHRNTFLAEVTYPRVREGMGFLDAVYLIEHRIWDGVGRFVIMNKFS